jgi:hypothetical protein
MVQSKIKQAIFAKLGEVEDMLHTSTCENESFADNLQAEMGWAAELDIALRTLTEAVDYYVD